MKRTIACAIPLLVAGAPLAAAPRVQAPDAAWKTLATAHYRIHYPASPEFESFAREIASKIEGIHAKVTEMVGFEARGPIQVLVRDPVMDANGLTVPLLDWPYVELWKTPPEADSEIAHYTSWVDLLVTHELTHIHHMMRPQNKPNLWERTLGAPVVGPVAQKAPRWVTEGYATLVEGRITGSGRPHGVYRAAVIRQWALQGKLPDYGALSGFQGFRGGSMAYLVGSAYLEWLERQNPKNPDILRTFWKQLASRKRRDFDESFKATFGLSARDGYDRWRAEATHDALELERRAKAENLLREGEVFIRLEGEATDLAVSPDGTKLMARVPTGKHPGIWVWDLNAKPRKSKSKKAKAPDPNEVEDRALDVPVREPRWRILRRDGALPRHACWTGPDQVTYELRYPNGEGVLEPTFRTLDLRQKVSRSSERPQKADPGPYRWQELDGTWNLVKLADGKEQRLTRTLSMAGQPAPSPDGKALFYVQLTATGCEIRKLDLTLPPLEDKPLPVDEHPIAIGAVRSAPDGPNTLPPPVTPPQVQDYSAMEGAWIRDREGFSVTPSGTSYQIGAGGMDLLGRLSWDVLAGLGDGAGPRGATAGFTWRGWRFAPSFTAFSALERPSSQRFLPVHGLDRERQGGELAFTYRDLGAEPYTFRPVLAAERVASQEGDKRTVSRAMGGLMLGESFRRSRGDWGAVASFRLQGAWGRTDGHSWNLNHDLLALRILNPVEAVVLKAETARVSEDATALDRLHLGGVGTSLVPTTLDWNRVEQAALPAFYATGDRMTRFRGEIGTGLKAYLEQTAVWDHTQPHGAYLRIAGVELATHEVLPTELMAPLLGRFQFTLGLHRILNDIRPGEPMKGRTVATISFVVRP